MPGVLRSLILGLTAFLTVVDLFATQAIVPALTTAYGVTPAAMGFAVNASTIGMAIGGLGGALFGKHLDWRRGILASLVLLAVPTALLATMPDLVLFTALRIAQALCMPTAFALTLACLGEHTSAADTASAFAAYITGNVASNLFGRPMAAGFVGRVAMTDRSSASGLYLANYFLGGLLGSAVPGQVFDRLGWTACVIGTAPALGAILAVRMEISHLGCPRRNNPAALSSRKIFGGHLLDRTNSEDSSRTQGCAEEERQPHSRISSDPTPVVDDLGNTVWRNANRLR